MIKEATLEYLDDLVKLENSSFTISSYPLSKFAFKKFIKKEHVYIYLDEQIFAGYILIIEYKHSVKIYSIAVSGNFRGKGIAKKLIEYIKQRFKTKKQILLEVRVDNFNAIDLYEKIGFKKVKTLQDYYLDGCDAYKMSFILNIT